MILCNEPFDIEDSSGRRLQKSSNPSTKGYYGYKSSKLGKSSDRNGEAAWKMDRHFTGVKECGMCNRYFIRNVSASKKADELPSEEQKPEIGESKVLKIEFKRNVLFTVIDSVMAGLTLPYIALKSINFKFCFLWSYPKLSTSSMLALLSRLSTTIMFPKRNLWKKCNCWNVSMLPILRQMTLVLSLLWIF